MLSHVWLFVTPWTAACQASLSITNSRSSPKPISIESVMPSNHLILCHPLLLLPSIFPSIRVFSNESALCIRWPKYWSFSFNISPSNEHPGSSAGKESTCNVGDLSLIPGLGTSPGEGTGNPIQFSSLEIPMDREAWWATVYGVAKSQTWLSNSHTHIHIYVCGCENWTKKKAECWRIDAFELWCWRRLLRVLWRARRSNKSILKEISP